MSLTIREALFNLADRMNLDTADMPTSNIADSIDYITEQLGNERGGNGVIANAVDFLTLDGGGSDELTEDFTFVLNGQGKWLTSGDGFWEYVSEETTSARDIGRETYITLSEDFPVSQVAKHVLAFGVPEFTMSFAGVEGASWTTESAYMQLSAFDASTGLSFLVADYLLGKFYIFSDGYVIGRFMMSSNTPNYQTIFANGTDESDGFIDNPITISVTLPKYVYMAG